ncbi:MAG: hypothetical protein K9G44_12130 [Melioribacteraceae bacterium]|nr:hypothetical protein [Melioribacteraceae bacterium]
MKFFFLIFLISIISISAQETNFELDLFSKENRQKFGDHLFCKSDYLRAIEEYRHYLELESNDTSAFKLAFSYAEIGRYNEAEDNFKTLFFSSEFSEEAKYEFFRVQFLKHDFEKLRSTLKLNTYLPTKYYDNIKKLEYYSTLLDENYFTDTTKYFNLFSNREKIEARNFYTDTYFPQKKDPTLAAILSIIPGLGKVYTENYGDAVTAFLYSTLLTYAAIDNYSAGHKTRGIILGSLGAAFYAGNIYGSYTSAQIFNAKISLNIDQNLVRYLDSVNLFAPVYDFLCGK